MPVALLITILGLGGLGLYLAMPGGPRGRRAAAYALLAGAGVLVLALLLRLVVDQTSPAWFAAFALIGLWGGVRVITHRRPVYSALYFLLVIVSVAVELVLLEAQFLAAALVIIYAGAILVTYLFVIMLAQQAEETAYDRQAREPLIGTLTGIVLLALIAARLLLPAPAAVSAAPAVAAEVDSVGYVGTHLLTHYVVGVEVAAILLLAAMVGAIAIARRKARLSAPGEDS